MASQGTPATALLAKQKVIHTLHEYSVDADTPNYGAVVAQAIGADPAQVFKTLVTEVDGALSVANVPVTGDIDLKALSAAAGGKKAPLPIASLPSALRATCGVESVRWGNVSAFRPWLISRLARPRSLRSRRIQGPV